MRNSVLFRIGSLACLLLTRIFFPPFVWAQQSCVDVVYLRDGGECRGVVLEAVGEKVLRVQTLEGEEYYFAVEEIERIEKKRSEEPLEFSFEDVVFLESGVVFRGRIVELVPWEILRVETRSGAQVQMRMEEVWKIVRQKRLAPPADAEPGEEEHESREVRALKMELQISLVREKSRQAGSGAPGAAGPGGASESERLEAEIARLKQELAEVEQPERDVEEAAALEEDVRRLIEELAQVAETGSKRRIGRAVTADELDLVQADLERKIHALSDQGLLGLEFQVAEEQQQEEEATVSAARGVDAMIEEDAWRNPELTEVFESSAASLESRRRHELYREHKAKGAALASSLNLVPALALGSWIQKDVWGGLLGCVTMASGAYVFLGLSGVDLNMGGAFPPGWTPPAWMTDDRTGFLDIATVPFVNLYLLFASANTVGKLGIAVFTAGYVYSLVRPYAYVGRYNRQLREGLYLYGAGGK